MNLTLGSGPTRSTAEACDYEARHAANVIHATFGGAA